MKKNYTEVQFFFIKRYRFMKPLGAYRSQIKMNMLNDSFISTKNKLYPNETIMNIPLTNQNAYDSFIHIKK